jgi:hypothetical protein
VRDFLIAMPVFNDPSQKRFRDAKHIQALLGIAPFKKINLLRSGFKTIHQDQGEKRNEHGQ